MIFSEAQTKEFANLKTQLESTKSLLDQAWYLPGGPYDFDLDKVRCQNNIDDILGRLQSFMNFQNREFDEEDDDNIEKYIKDLNISIYFFKRGKETGAHWWAIRSDESMNGTFIGFILKWLPFIKLNKHEELKSSVTALLEQVDLVARIVSSPVPTTAAIVQIPLAVAHFEVSCPTTAYKREVQELRPPEPSAPPLPEAEVQGFGPEPSAPPLPEDDERLSSKKGGP